VLAVAVLATAAFSAVGRAFYADFHLPQGTGMTRIVPEEATFVLMFCAFGSAAVLGFAGALGTGTEGRLRTLLRAAASRPAAAAAVLGALALLASLAVSRLVLHGAAVTDDEHTYRFIAQTLRTGSLTAPSPRTDLPFFREQFVVLTPEVRYGKYPVGFPLLLALGQALGMEAWVVPALTGVVVVLVYVVGRTLFGARVALAASALTAASPQIVLTGGTLLSQPASAACLLGAVAALVCAERAWRDTGAAARAPLAVAGALLGAGAFVRPLPGVLFVAAAGLHLLWQRGLRPWRGTLATALAFGVPAAALTSLLLVQNAAQSGDVLTSGYQTFHGTGAGSAGLLPLVGGHLADLAMSVAAGLLRLVVWAFGWPFAPLLALLAWRADRAGLLWVLLAADLAYRVISPKAGVSPTGPVYLYEAVPLLALLAAAGAARLARDAPGRLKPATLLLAGAIVSVSMFLPGRLADLALMGMAQRTPFLLLERKGVRRALVFQSAVVPWQTGLSWAYYPPHNAPSLDDDVLFLHVDGPAELPAARELWRRRFPDRSAWWFDYAADGPRLVPLDEALAESAAVSPAPPS
jgi:dolichyl-phosphate-mannose-protein mannosyltransferase